MSEVSDWSEGVCGGAGYCGQPSLAALEGRGALLRAWRDLCFGSIQRLLTGPGKLLVAVGGGGGEGGYGVELLCCRTIMYNVLPGVGWLVFGSPRGIVVAV